MPKAKRRVKDHVDRILDRGSAPRSDANVVEFTSRLARIMTFCERLISNAYAELGLKHGEIDVLDALLLSPGEAQSPKTVGAALLCSSGAMTNRLDRLEEAGLIRRRHGISKDRRAVVLSITPEGRKAAKRASVLRDSLTDRLLPGLSVSERKTLVGLFRKMLVEFETSEPQI